MAETVPPTRRPRPALRSLSGAEARAYLADPNRKGNMEAMMKAGWGLMTEEEAAEFEANINAMCERIEEPKEVSFDP